MHAEVMRRLPDTDILIMAAAVADYRVADGPTGGKIGKGRDEWCIDLAATPDILCDVAAHHKGQFLVGFAAEYGLEGLDRARGKMERKNLDMIVFNDISRTDIGFDSDYNEVRVLSKDAEVLIDKAPKETVAELILDNVALAVRARRGETPLPA
jgi:phosphopantothenoylcysteine decarboxylase/phosphopantothenate--cysteine ligase